MIIVVVVVALVVVVLVLVFVTICKNLKTQVLVTSVKKLRILLVLVET